MWNEGAYFSSLLPTDVKNGIFKISLSKHAQCFWILKVLESNAVIAQITFTIYTPVEDWSGADEIWSGADGVWSVYFKPDTDTKLRPQ